jgi:hypothetical protein
MTKAILMCAKPSVRMHICCPGGPSPTSASMMLRRASCRSQDLVPAYLWQLT